MTTTTTHGDLRRRIDRAAELHEEARGALYRLWMSTNNKPEIVGTDDAIWDRIRLVPFTQRFNGAAEDPALPGKLRDELPGVLAWAVRGCLEWQRDGLGEPDEVKAATRAYRDEMDVLGTFIGECCKVSDNSSAPASYLYAAYEKWCDRTGETAESQTKFGTRLGERGFVNERATSGAHKGRIVWHGIGLLYAPDPDGDGAPSERLWWEKSDESDESDESSTPTPPEGERLAENRSPEKTLQNKKNHDDKHTSGEQSEPVGDINEDLNSPEGVIPESGSHRSHRSPETGGDANPKPAVDPKPERLTEDQVRKVQRLMSEGMDPKIARREVLGEGRKRGGVA